MTALSTQIRDLSRILGQSVRTLKPLGGGCIGAVFAATLEDGTRVVAKGGAGGEKGALICEGWMLGYLKEHSALPVPGVIYAGDDYLVMDYIESDGALTESAQTHAAEILAALHAIPAALFGLERDTRLGGLLQPNRQDKSWVAFFREQRLLFMARAAYEEGALDKALFARLEKFSQNLDRWIGEPESPSLIHGDLWHGNILCRQNRIAGFIDPAIYYADAEIELAFATLFSTFDGDFFRRYDEIRPIHAGFFGERRDIYNLYPLLVHVRLFGGHYPGAVARTLAQFGF